MYEAIVRRLRKMVKAHKEIYGGSTEESVAVEQAADAIEELTRIVKEYQKFDGFLAAHGMFEPPKEET